MAYSVVVTGDTIDGTDIDRNASNPTVSFQRRVERFPPARNESEALIEDEAYFNLIQTVPQIFRGLFLTSINGKPNGIDGWLYTLTYTRRQALRIGFFDYNGDSTGGMIKRTHSIRTVGAYGLPGKRVPNNRNGINWNGTVFEGVEIPSPTYAWSETWGHPLNVMSNPYIAMCRSMTASVNTIPFRGFLPGEVLFKGIADSVEIVDDGAGGFVPMWRIAYNFEVSPNVYDIQVGDIMPFNKLGLNQARPIAKT